MHFTTPGVNKYFSLEPVFSTSRGRLSSKAARLQRQRERMRTKSATRNFRHSRKQRLRISILRRLQDLLRHADLYNPPRLHHRNARSELRHHRQTMRNQDQRKRKFPLQTRQQFQYLRAHGNI